MIETPWLAEDEHSILDNALQALQRATGLSARVLPASASVQMDAVLEIMVGAQTLRFAVDIKQPDRLATLMHYQQQRAAHALPRLLVASRMTPHLAEQCRALDLSFIDTAGNAYLQAPGVFVLVTGRQVAAAQALRQSRPRSGTPASLRVMFALLCQPALWQASYREISQMAGVSLGAIGGVLADLSARGLIVAGTRQRRVLEPERLRDEWVINYPIRLRSKLNIKRFRAHDPDWWRTLDVQRYGACWGGEVAADQLTRFIKPATCTLYVDAGPDAQYRKRLVLDHQLRADPDGDVMLLDRFWTFPAAPSAPDTAPPLLIYADLLATQDPRNSEAAQLIRERYLEHADA